MDPKGQSSNYDQTRVRKYSLERKRDLKRQVLRKTTKGIGPNHKL